MGSRKHDARDAPVTVIWRTPDGDNCSIEHHFVALHGQLMCAGNQIYGVIMDELFGDVSAEEIPCTSRRYTPSLDI